MTAKRGRPSTLTEAQRQEIYVLDAQGMKYQDIAKKMSRPPGQVLYWIFKNAKTAQASSERHSMP
jgi:DNA-directed RNA polymerase specialized sigma24 family protein